MTSRFPKAIVFAVLAWASNCYFDDQIIRPESELESVQQPESYGRPTAMAYDDQSRSLWVVSTGGWISRIQTTDFQTTRHWQIDGELVDVQVTADGLFVLASDPAKLLRFRLAESGELQRQEELSLSIAADRLSKLSASSLAIASRWGRQITIVDLPTESTRPLSEAEVQEISLPFAPDSSLSLPVNQHLVVLAAFGGEVALIDRVSGTVITTDDTGGHNSRGVTLSRDGSELLIAQQILNRHVPLTIASIEFGDVLKHVVRRIEVASILAAEDHWAASSDFYELGFAGLAATDPSGIELIGDESWLVPLSGVHQVALIAPETLNETRIDVGKGPIDVAIDSAQAIAFVLCRFEPAVDMIDLKSAKKIGRVELPLPGQISNALIGEERFFDAALSRDRWISCHSCHTDGHANGRLADTLGDGTTGTPKRVLSLHGVAHSEPWAWDGSVDSLSEQIEKSIQLTMRGSVVDESTIIALETYLRTLPSTPPFRLVTEQSSETIQQGAELFVRLGCSDCHDPNAAYTSADHYDVGLADELGKREFNPPSLKGVGHREQLFHDGRANSLQAVLGTHLHGIEASLSEADLLALVQFLESR